MIAFFRRRATAFLDPAISPGRNKLIKTLVSCIALLFCLAIAYQAQPAQAEGSRDLYPNGATGARASMEWRNSYYGGGALLRRTLLKVYANAGEYIMLGSSAVGAPLTPPNYLTSLADILVYNPGLVTGTIGQESIPATASFSCLAQRAQTGNAALGRIATRIQEVNGPDTIINPATGTTGGSITRYAPCYYQAPVTGIYNVAFYGPAGDNRNSETAPSGSIADVPENFNATQDTTISSWDVTVRFRLDAVTPEFHGRLFSSYLTLYTGGNARPLFSSVYPISTDGYQYRADLRGLDPNGFVLYANQVGFFNSDGATPLYHDVLAATNAFNQNQLSTLQGGVMLAPPRYPIFFNPPDGLVLAALGIPQTPTVPVVSNLSFTGTIGITTFPGKGGTFRYTSNVGGIFELVISRDGINYDSTNPLNRVLRGLRGPGAQSIDWDGQDNSGGLFPVGGPYKVSLKINAGELHFPLIDAENSPLGGPTYTLLNSPVPGCTNQPFGCTTAFYDDRGYRTLNGSVVGQLGVELCGQNPPVVTFSLSGFDSASPQRAFGGFSGGNAGVVCNASPPGTGAFGDTKGLDLWSFFPSNFLAAFLYIVDQPPPTPAPTTTPIIDPILPPSATPTATSGTPTTTPAITPTPTPEGSGSSGSGGGGGAGSGTGTPGSGTGTPGSGTGTPGSGTSGGTLPGLPNTGRLPEASGLVDSWLVLGGSFGLGLLLLGMGIYLIGRRTGETRNEKR